MSQRLKIGILYLLSTLLQQNIKSLGNSAESSQLYLQNNSDCLNYNNKRYYFCLFRPRGTCFICSQKGDSTLLCVNTSLWCFNQLNISLLCTIHQLQRGLSEQTLCNFKMRHHAVRGPKSRLISFRSLRAYMWLFSLRKF